MAVNLLVDLGPGDRYGDAALALAQARANARGVRLVHAGAADDRLCAWIDWQFAPSWWSSEARAGRVWYALDEHDAIVGFAAYDVRGFAFPWLRGYDARPEIGMFGPYGVAPAWRGRAGIGTAILDAALCSLRARGYASALIPAVGEAALVAMYEERVGARVADTLSYDPPRRFRATILASGGGTNAQHVLDRSADGTLPLDVSAIVANRADAGVLARARAAHVAASAVVWDRAHESRDAYDARVIDTVAATEPDLVLLLGWMHRLPPSFIARFPEILNVHPAFLPFDGTADDVTMPDGSRIPAFRGAHAVRDALAADAAWLGASVHRVTPDVDRGAIVVRTPLERNGVVTADQASAALRPLEHAAVAKAIRRWIFEQMGRA